MIMYEEISLSNFYQSFNKQKKNGDHFFYLQNLMYDFSINLHRCSVKHNQRILKVLSISNDQIFLKSIFTICIFNPSRTNEFILYIYICNN